MEPSQQRGWWGRNWVWVVPVGCLAPIALCAGGVALVATFVFGTLKSIEPYKEAVARAGASPAVQAALGQPIQVGFLVSGDVTTSVNNGVSSGTADLSIPISGPSGSATIEVKATKADGVWAYSVLRVHIAGQDQPIDLLGGG